MERLPMCRICLAENVRLCIVANKNLHKLYEKLTDIPFVAEDSRPIVACVFCCAKLKQCYRLLHQCQKAEIFFAQRMNCKSEPNSSINENRLEVFGGLMKSPVKHINIVGHIAVEEDLSVVCDGPDDVIEPKEEYQSDVSRFGGTRRGRGRRGRGGRGRGGRGGRGRAVAGSGRSGPSTIEELKVYDINELPVGRPLEVALHSNRKRRWPPAAPAPIDPLQMAPQVVVEEVRPSSPPPPQMTEVRVEVVPLPSPSPPQMDELRVEEVPLPSPSPPQMAEVRVEVVPLPSPSPPQMAEVRVEVVPLPSPSPPQMAEGRVEEVPLPSPPPRQIEDVSPVPSPSLFLECESASSMLRPRRSLRDEQIDDQLFYGSEPDSDASDEDDVFPSLIPRAQRSFWETPLDIDDADDQPAASSVDANIPSVPPTATDRPWGLYEFDWKPFPNVPIPPKSRREMFSHNDVGPTAPCVDPYEIFVNIWDRQFMEYIATETNRYAQQLKSRMLDGGTLLPNSRIRMWRNTSADELYVYFGVVIAMGVVIKSRIDEYWNSSPDVFFTPGFSAHMSGQRFMLLSKCLHFVNNHDMCEQDLGGSEAKLFKVQPLLSHLNNKFQSLYRLGQNIALDESLLQWKGWLDISQLIPNKAARVGIKTYEICESQTGYLWRFEVHASGKSQRCPPQQDKDPMNESTPAIVLRLTKGLEGKGHTLWMDNFYNSPCLARRLKVLGFDCVGTLRTNRKFVPEALNSLTKENMAKDQITGLTSGDVDVMVWRDNNRVAMISTYHGNAVSQARNLSTKPILINDYNLMMGGVDKKDQMLAMYPIERKRTRVWYKKLFRRLLNISILNSFIIHSRSVSSTSTPTSSTRSTSLSHRNFRMCLVKALLSKHFPSLPTLQPAITPSMHQNTAIHDVRSHHLAEYPFGAKSKRQRQRRKCTNVDCRKLVHTYCVGCNKAMCLNRCFVILHQ